jgi:hypothetical protein
VAGFDDLLALAGRNGGFVHTEERGIVAGGSASWGYHCVDDEGDLVDLRAGFAGAYRVRDAAGAQVLAVPVIFPLLGIVNCRVTSALTNDLPAGTHHQEFRITRASDGAVLPLIAGWSTFVVLPKGS